MYKVVLTHMSGTRFELYYDEIMMDRLVALRDLSKAFPLVSFHWDEWIMEGHDV